jgi:oxygen-dependent protoporphyrinogen oxidase
LIAVVGGGITGLALGWELDRLGIDFVVLEGSDRPGGVIRSAEVGGHLLDWGPQRLRLTGDLAGMVQDLELDDEVVTAPEGLDLFIYRDGRLRAVPFSLVGFVGADVLSLRGKFRALLEPFTDGPRPGERVASYFSRKFGREVYETIIGPLYGGLYSTDPAQMEVDLSLIHVLRQFRVGRSLLLRLLRRGGRITAPPACTFRSGMQTLPNALARRLGARFRPSSRVRRIERVGSQWRVRLDDGTDFDARDVVVTTPARVATELLGSSVPTAAAAVSKLRYNRLAMVHLEAETDLQGTGFKVSLQDRQLALSGVTFNHSLFGRENLYTAYVCGGWHAELMERDDEGLAELAVRDFRVTTGFDARPISVERVEVPAWDTSWDTLRDFSLPDGLHVAANWKDRPGIPGRLAQARRLAGALADRSLAAPSVSAHG